MSVSITIQVSVCCYSKSGAVFAMQLSDTQNGLLHTVLLQSSNRQHFFASISLDFPHLPTAGLFSPSLLPCFNTVHNRMK